MNNKKCHIFMHYFPGESGEFRLKNYLQTLHDYCKLERYDYHFTLMAYQADEEDLMKLAELRSLKTVAKVQVLVRDQAFGELPTLNKMIELVRNVDANDWVIYAHVKGSSYRDKNIYLKQSICNLQCILEAVSHENFSILEKYFDAVGCNLAMGVFERYSFMNIHYSGNFFAIRANMLQKAMVFEEKFYSPVHRHLAEKFISDIVPANKLFNLYTNYIITPDDTLTNYNKDLFNQKMLSLCKYTEKDFTSLKRTTADIANFYYNKQVRYSVNRPFWRLRRVLFGNSSVLMRSRILVRIINLLLPWYNSELYRYNLLPDSFELLKNGMKEK